VRHGQAELVDARGDGVPQPQAPLPPAGQHRAAGRHEARRDGRAGSFLRALIPADLARQIGLGKGKRDRVDIVRAELRAERADQPPQHAAQRGDIAADRIPAHIGRHRAIRRAAELEHAQRREFPRLPDARRAADHHLLHPAHPHGGNRRCLAPMHLIRRQRADAGAQIHIAQRHRLGLADTAECNRLWLALQIVPALDSTCAGIGGRLQRRGEAFHDIGDPQRAAAALGLIDPLHDADE
jgi:hypothetical protein